MTKITDAKVEAALQSWFKEGSAWNRQMTHDVQQDMRASMRAALEAAEDVPAKAESNLQKVQIPTSTIPEGFIPWHGGECPVAGRTVVDCVMRGRYVVHESAAKNLRWNHLNEDDTRIIADIIAYRIHKPADFRLEAGKFYVTASGERVGPMRHNPGAYGSTYQVSGDWGRWWWPNGKIGLLGSCEPDILALSSNQGGS